MISGNGSDSDGLSLESLRRIDALAAQFEAAWSAGNTPRIESYLDGVPEPESAALFLELLRSELELCNGQTPALDVAVYLARFPHRGEIVRAVFRDLGNLGPGIDASAQTPPRCAAALTGSKVLVESAARAAGYYILHELGRGGMAVVPTWRGKIA